MKYEIIPSNQFRKDIKTAQKRGYDISQLRDIIAKLSNGERLDTKHRDHLLSGNYGNFRECHIQPDWLLVYQIQDNELVLYLLRTGTHSDLF